MGKDRIPAKNHQGSLVGVTYPIFLPIHRSLSLICRKYTCFTYYKVRIFVIFPTSFKPSEHGQQKTTHIAELNSLSDNILSITIEHRAEIDFQAAEDLVSTANGMMNTGIPFGGVIYDLTGITYIYDKARDHLANGDGLKGSTVGIGLVADSSIGKMNCNLFVLLGRRAKFPIKVFETTTDAEHWLRNRMNMALEAMSAA